MRIAARSIRRCSIRFVDGTKSGIEMTAICSATGLHSQVEGLSFPPASRFEHADICKPKADGGVLEKGVTEVTSSSTATARTCPTTSSRHHVGHRLVRGHDLRGAGFIGSSMYRTRQAIARRSTAIHIVGWNWASSVARGSRRSRRSPISSTPDDVAAPATSTRTDARRRRRTSAS